jgi:hypothetical protein
MSLDWVTRLGGGDRRQGYRACQVMVLPVRWRETDLTQPEFQQMVARIEQESYHTHHFHERDIWLATTALMGPHPVAIS